MASELARHKIRVSTVHPAGVNTPMDTGLGGLEQLIGRDPHLGPGTAGAVAITRATRSHEEIRQGSSVRGVIDLTLVAGQLLNFDSERTRDSAHTEQHYRNVVYDATGSGWHHRSWWSQWCGYKRAGSRMWRSHCGWRGANSPGFRRVTRGCCCCQTAYITPVPARGRWRLGRGRLRPVRTHRDVAPALGSFSPTSEEYRMAIIVVATAFPAPEHRAEVVAAFEAAIAHVHSEEPGCELYALHEGRDRLVMIEKYASQDAVEAHRKGAGLAGLVTALQGKLSAPLDVQILAPHPAGSADKGAI